MDCDRLQTLIKSWYVQVQDEALAPARMVSFMEKHIEECATCLADPVVKTEIERITTIVLPPSKIPKAVKDKEAKEKAAEKAAEEIETEEVETEEVETEEDEDTNEEETKENDSDDTDDEDEDDVDPDKLEQLTTTSEDDDV